MSMFNDVIWRIKDNEWECIANATLVSLFAKRHFCRGDTIETVFRTMISVNELSIYGAVSDLCEECGACEEPVTCREYTLPRDEKSTAPKGGIRGNTKIGPVLEVTTSYLQDKYGVEIWIEYVNKHNSHSWVRISHGLNKSVTDLSNNKEDDDNGQETSTTKTEVFVFASRSKAEAQPRRLSTTCPSTRTVPILERIWNDFEPGAQFDQAYTVAKRLNTLLRHGQLPREEDGAIELWRLRWSSEEKFEHSEYWVWWCMEEQDGRRRRQQEKISILYWSVRTRNSLPPSSSRSFRTQSCWFYTAGQCVDSEQFLRVHLSHWMCNQFTLHHKFRIDTGRTKFKQGKRQYSLRLWIPWKRNTKIRTSLTSPNHVLHGTSRNGGKDTKTRCIGSIYSLLNVKDWSSIKQDVLQSSSMIHSSFLYLESCCDWIWRNHLRESICVTSTSSNNFLQREIETDVLFGREGTKHSTRTGRPVDGPKSIQSCVSIPVQIVDKYEDEDQTRTVRPVGGQQSTQLEERDIDFRVPGLSHAVVKQAENFRIQEHVKKSKVILIERHFKPTCSRITSTTHPATIRRRWSADWAM